MIHALCPGDHCQGLVEGERALSDFTIKEGGSSTTGCHETLVADGNVSLMKPVQKTSGVRDASG